MQETHQPGSPAPQPSALLRCLSQLNTDTWAQVLLPKLVEQKSAAQVALSCTQLRDLCYSSRQSINLGALLDSTGPIWTLRSLVRTLPTHFPNCSTVSLELPTLQSYDHMPYLLPMLARLSRLDELSMRLAFDPPAVAACTLLCSMQAQLPRLHGLTLTVEHPKKWLAAESVQRELGEFSQLTRLSLNLAKMEVRDPPSYAAVQHLSGLKHLQHLTIWAKWDFPYLRYYGQEYPWPVAPAQLLPALTGLTRLQCNLSGLSTLAGLSSCINLQHLAVCMAQDNDRTLGPADWAGLAVLTGLTELRLLNVDLLEPSPEACEVLSKLTKLQVAAAATWSQAFLPALTPCVQLTEVCGCWQWLASSEGVGVTLPQVLVLSLPGIVDPPLAARHECFPNLRCWRENVLVDGTQCVPDAAMHPSDLQALCQHCTGLRELVLSADSNSLDPDNDELSCVTAIQSLTSLQHLTRLAFTPSDGHDLMALVQACCVLEGHSLQELHITEGCDSTISGAVWLHLAAVRRLRKLSVSIVCEDAYDFLAEDASAFLGALSGCGSVLLCLPGPSEPFKTALRELREAGLPPLQVEFVIN